MIDDFTGTVSDKKNNKKVEDYQQQLKRFFWK